MTRGTDELEPTRLSRRAALQGIAGGAIVWTTPTILSATAAGAATVAHPCVSCGPDPCLDQTACGTDSNSGLACFCSQEVGTGVCTCTQDVPCASATPCPGGSCPPGFACQISCCGTALCFPLCT